MPHRHVNLLLIEDDEDDYVLTKDLLEDIPWGNFDITWAQDLAQARECLAANQQDLCLLDYRLGPHDGLALLREAPSLGFTAPIIMLTGQNSPELDIDASRSGAVDYLVKNELNERLLSRALRYALARQDTETERVERLRAEAKSQAKNDFLARLSHELRTPLTAILGYTEILIAKQTNREEKTQLETVRRNGRHLLNLLNDILDLSKIEAGKLDLDISRIAIAPFLADFHSLLVAVANEQGLEFTIECPQPIPTHITSDPVRLRQILLNLANNAIKFTKQGQVRLRLTYTSSESVLYFHVIDTGIGIPANELESLFEPFQQGSNHQLHGHKGSGLGLAICRQLSSRLNGAITAHSETHVGSTFTLALNLDQHSISPDNLAIPDLNSEQLLASAEAGLADIKLSGHVLIVDDEPVIRGLLGELAHRVGLTTEYASSGEMAVEKICDTSNNSRPAIDLVLMDIQMSGIDGREATQLIRSRGFCTPVIALSAATMKGEHEKCLAVGCNAFLSKPVDTAQLYQLLEQFLANATGDPALDILIVEDNPDAGGVLKLILSEMGHRPVLTHNGQSALLEYQTPYDLALIDLQLPDMSGQALAQQMQQQAPDQSTYLVALSGTDVSNRDGSALFHAHLVKPVAVGELEQLIARVRNHR